MQEVHTPAEAIAQLVEREKIVNLTPHPIRFLASWFVWIGDPEEATLELDSPYVWAQTNAQKASGDRGSAMQWVTIPPSGEPYRMGEQDSPGDWTDLNFGAVVTNFMPETGTGVVAGIVTRKLRIGRLPNPEEGVTFIVSLPALMGLVAAGANRRDVIAPDTGSTAERDTHGQIVGVRGFVRLS